MDISLETFYDLLEQEIWIFEFRLKFIIVLFWKGYEISKHSHGCYYDVTSQSGILDTPSYVDVNLSPCRKNSKMGMH